MPLKSPEVPARREIWIALRGDQAGSGTMDDPYDGSTFQEPPKTVTQIARLTTTAPDNTIAVATSPSHGFRIGDVITITGVPPGLEPFAGVFRIFSVTTDTFRYKMQTAPSGNASGAGMNCFRTIYRFDEVMRSMPYLDGNPSALPGLGKLPPRCTVHIGPGTFETTGFVYQTIESTSAPSVIPFGWLAQSGQRFVGSGIDVTVLKLVNATDPNFNTVAIQGTDVIAFSAVLDGFEASDFTIDSNLQGQPVPAGFKFAPVCCGGMTLWGNHIRLRRIRCINWGTQSPPECFVLVVLFPSQNPDQCVDNVIEQCIVEQPSLNNNHETTILSATSGDPSGTDVPRPTGFNRACVVRDCYVNCEYLANPVSITSLSYAPSGSDTLVTVNTLTQHNRTAGQWIIISGVENAGGIFNAFNGSFQVEVSGLSATSFQYKVKNLQIPSSGTLTGRMFVDRWSSMVVPIANLARYTDPNDPLNKKLVKLTTPAGHPHFRRPGNNVVPRSTGSRRYEGDPLPSSPTPPPTGTTRLPVKQVLSPTEFIYELPVDIPDDSSGDPPVLDANAEIGVNFQVLGGCNVFERSVAINCYYGIYRDTGSMREQILRYCYFRDLYAAVQMNLNQAGSAPYGVALLAPLANTDGRLAQLTVAVTPFENFKLKTAASVPHSIRVSGAITSMGVANSYNSLPDDTPGFRHHQVRSSDVTSIVYELFPPTSETPSGSVQYSHMYQVGFFCASKNVFEANYTRDRPSLISHIALGGRGLDGVYTFRKLLLLDNHFRQADDWTVPTNTWAINVNRVESTWLAHNHISTSDHSLAGPEPIRIDLSRAVVDVGNFAADGSALFPKRTNTVPEKLISYPELYEEFDDALSVAF